MKISEVVEGYVDKKDLLKLIKYEVSNGINGNSFDIMNHHFDIDSEGNLYIDGILSRGTVIGGIKGKIINYLYNVSLSKEKTSHIDIQALQADRFFKHNKKLTKL